MSDRMGLFPSSRRSIPREMGVGREGGVVAGVETRKLKRRRLAIGGEAAQPMTPLPLHLSPSWPEKARGTRKRRRGGGLLGAPATIKPRSSYGERLQLASCTSPGSTFPASHPDFIWYDVDMWTEVARHLAGRDLVSLGLTNRWFHRLFSEQCIWRYACLRDLQVPPPRHMSFPWNLLYASAFDGSHSYTFRQPEKHIDWMRIGAIFLSSTEVLLAETLVLPSRLPQIGDDIAKSIQTTGTCLLTGIRTGIWIADLQLVRCPVCNLNTCEGTMQVLDVRHLELFLEQGFKDGSWEYEEIGSHRIQKQCNAATGALFDVGYLQAPSVTGKNGLLDAESWIGKKDDWQPKARLTLHAVAVNTNLQPHEGIQVRFQAMKNGADDGEIVSLRISQQLI